MAAQTVPYTDDPDDDSAEPERGDLPTRAPVPSQAPDQYDYDYEGDDDVTTREPSESPRQRRRIFDPPVTDLGRNGSFLPSHVPLWRIAASGKSTWPPPLPFPTFTYANGAPPFHGLPMSTQLDLTQT